MTPLLFRTQQVFLAMWAWIRKHPSIAMALIFGGIGIQAFLELAEALPHGDLWPIDHLVRVYILTHQYPLLTGLAMVLSAALNWPYVLLLLLPFVIYLLYKRQDIMAAGLVIIPCLTALLIGLLKHLFQRPRPSVLEVIERGYSFPSGHALSAMVIYGLLGYIAWRCWARKKRDKTLIVVIVVLLVLATGCARVYLSVHYPSDVLAGWAAGAAVLFGSIALLETLQKPKG